MSMSIRIARTHSKKDKVAFSGYHGWSDWYLATNLTGENNLSTSFTSWPISKRSSQWVIQYRIGV